MGQKGAGGDGVKGGGRGWRRGAEEKGWNKWEYSMVMGLMGVQRG